MFPQVLLMIFRECARCMTGWWNWWHKGVDLYLVAFWVLIYMYIWWFQYGCYLYGLLRVFLSMYIHLKMLANPNHIKSKLSQQLRERCGNIHVTAYLHSLCSMNAWLMINFLKDPWYLYMHSIHGKSRRITRIDWELKFS